jgi:hypothetical protein
MPTSEALNHARADCTGDCNINQFSSDGTTDQSGFGILPTELYVHVFFAMEIRVRHGGSFHCD